MLFVPLLLLLTLIAVSLYFSIGIPGVLAWLCLVLGGLAIISRGIAWISGTQKAALRMLSETAGPKAVRYSIAMDLAIWTLGIANVYFFFYRVAG